MRVSPQQLHHGWDEGKRLKEFFKTLLNEHKWLILFVAVALIVGILILTINLWRTLLLLLLVSIAVVFGYLMDKDGFSAVKEFFSRIFTRRKNV